ncbi:flavin-containing monooxygenase [Mycolicibacterium palauense]|uniref:flavin-containing monooxygenase n=1 Tax=Mycolicibacterium palauense TaxID=2034511 RepID=UPI00159B90F2|nr:NAD(P)/FAD-dependent oxidoreductase [Mycolicibacterium palauense]
MTAIEERDVLVIGAGFGGLCAAVKLAEAGVGNFLVLDKGETVGGTWRDNDYPGAAVDISTLQYSLSFEPGKDWSRIYATQPELLGYIRGIIEKRRLNGHFRFNTEVTGLTWDEEALCWDVAVDGRPAYRAQFVISATGILSSPRIPAIEGAESFPGPSFHSAHWGHEVDLRDKRVAVVGAGASAVQFVPAIVDDVASMTVYQRSAPWVYPRGDRLITGWERFAYRYIPGALRLRRWQRWVKNDIDQLVLERNGKGVETYRAAGLAHIQASIADPELRALVTPDYLPGCKRRVISDDWYPALQRPHVEVTKASPRRIGGTTIVDTDGVERDFDVLIYGTGFAATSFLGSVRVTGCDGEDLHRHWAAGASTHLGITVSGFPNFFLVFGPNTGLGNNSALVMIESQVRYIVAAVTYQRRRAIRALTVKPTVERHSYASVQLRFDGTVYTSGCAGWYQSPDGHVDTLWPGSTAEYWWKTRKFDRGSYQQLDPASATAGSGTTRREVTVGGPK